MASLLVPSNHYKNNCDIAMQLNQSTVYTALNGVHLITCILTIFLSVQLYNAWRSRVYFHANVKILLNTMLALAVVHSIAMSSFLFLNVASWLLYDGTCDALMFNGKMCLLLRHPTNICIAGLVLCQLSIAAERVVATWIGSSYNTYSSQLGRVLSAATVISSVILLCPLLVSETTTEPQINCGFPSSTAAEQNWILMLELLSLDVISVLVFILVYCVSLYKKTGAMFHLEKRYQINENLYVTRTLLPVTFLHFSLFAVLCAAIVFIEFLYKDPFTIIYYEVVFYTAPFYTVLFPLIILHVIKQLDRDRKSKELSEKLKKIPELAHIIVRRAETAQQRREGFLRRQAAREQAEIKDQSMVTSCEAEQPKTPPPIENPREENGTQLPSPSPQATYNVDQLNDPAVHVFDAYEPPVRHCAGLKDDVRELREMFEQFMFPRPR